MAWAGLGRALPSALLSLESQLSLTRIILSGRNPERAANISKTAMAAWGCGSAVRNDPGSLM